MTDRIRLEAYKLFAHRGAGDGRALDDWLAAEREVCWPAVEFAEQGDTYTLKVALPGFDPKEITVTAAPREIIVKAAREQRKSGENPDANVEWSEFKANDVFRRIELPADVNVGGIKADLKNGLLEVTAPKATVKSSEVREIELSTPS